jgi:hypothetical protein
MKYDYLSVMTNGKEEGAGAVYRVYIVGRPDYHMMDWNGCNFRRLALPKEYRKTFIDMKAANLYCNRLEAMENQDQRFSKYARTLGDGAYFDERTMVFFHEKV